MPDPHTRRGPALGFRAAVWLSALFLLFGMRDAVGAAEPATPPKPELAPDSALLARIAELPENTWLKLPPPKTAGDLAWAKGRWADYQNGPSVRDYCNRMVWAPERRRAVYCGAGHNIHPWNDVWEYDLAANTWVCLRAPDPDLLAPKVETDEELIAAYRKNYVLRDGAVTTRSGAPVRPAHTWWGLCYDTDQRRMVLWDAHKGLMFTHQILKPKLLAQALGLKDNDPVLRLSGSGPGEAWVFGFSPQDAAWNGVFTNAPKAYEASQLEYLSDRKTFLLISGQTYVSDPTFKTWKPVAKGGPPSNAVTAYDPETGSVVAAGRRAFVYSCDEQKWSERAALEGDGGSMPRSVMSFDSAARQFVLFTTVEPGDKTLPPVRLWTYDLKADKWTRPATRGDVPPRGSYAGYYDPARNVSVYTNGRSGVWVVRGRK